MRGRRPFRLKSRGPACAVVEHKIGPTRRLYRMGLDRADVLSLSAFIGWVPALLERRFGGRLDRTEPMLGFFVFGGRMAVGVYEDFDYHGNLELRRDSG